MLIPKIGMTSFALGLTLAMSCSSDDTAARRSSEGEAGTPKGGGVGSACDADSQCTGFSKPSCVTDIKPLADLVSADPMNKPFRDFHLPFPGGYCGTTLEDGCTADAECGAGAGCFLAFEGVPQATIDNLNATGLPFDVSAFAKVGLCLQTCTKDAECRTGEGYACIRPLDGFIKLFNADYAKTFCAVSVDDQITVLLSPPADAGP